MLDESVNVLPVLLSPTLQWSTVILSLTSILSVELIITLNNTFCFLSCRF